MKLWLLTAPRVVCEAYDCLLAAVVRAPSNRAARRMAFEVSGDEGGEAWLDTGRSTCIRLTDEGKPGVVLTDFRAT